MIKSSKKLQIKQTKFDLFRYLQTSGKVKEILIKTKDISSHLDVSVG